MTLAPAPGLATRAGVPPPRVRVMLVDDSAVIRGLLNRMLSADPLIEVVTSASNGQQAVQQIERFDVDVVILDIEMPVMDGLTALPKLLASKPNVAVIIASTLSQRGAEVSLKAMSLGAADYIPKPGSGREIAGGDAFQRDLLEKVKSLGAKSLARRRAAPPPSPAPAAARTAAPVPVAGGAIALRPAGSVSPRIIAIGSSTGGPQALFKLLKVLPRSLKLPIVITQHMPPTFTAILAQHIAAASGWPTREAAEGDRLEAGTIYLARGDHHMLIERKDPGYIIRLNQGPQENFCRPAVDPMLRSVVRAFGPAVLAAILTGMGRDGLAGGRDVVAAGGTVVAQDEASSVVWGMPGAVATAGICSAVLPLDALATYVTKLAGGSYADGR